MADNPDKRVEREKPVIDKALAKGDIEGASKELVPPGNRIKQVEAAVKMAVYGASWSEIASTLDFPTPTLARQAVERYLADHVTEDDRAQARWMASQRLLRVMRSLSVKASSETILVKNEDGVEVEVPNHEHLDYAKVFLHYVDRHIKLHGLDMPTELNVTYTPRAEELRQTVEGLLTTIRGEMPAEADILEADILEEEEPDGG